MERCRCALVPRALLPRRRERASARGVGGGRRVTPAQHGRVGRTVEADDRARRVFATPVGRAVDPALTQCQPAKAVRPGWRHRVGKEGRRRRWRDADGKRVGGRSEWPSRACPFLSIRPSCNSPRGCRLLPAAARRYYHARAPCVPRRVRFQCRRRLRSCCFRRRACVYAASNEKPRVPSARRRVRSSAASPAPRSFRHVRTLRAQRRASLQCCVVRFRAASVTCARGGPVGASFSVAR